MLASDLGSIHHFLVINSISVGTDLLLFLLVFRSKFHLGNIWDALQVYCIERFKKKEEQTIEADKGVFSFLQVYFANSN